MCRARSSCGSWHAIRRCSGLEHAGGSEYHCRDTTPPIQMASMWADRQVGSGSVDKDLGRERKGSDEGDGDHGKLV
jgi:hypothetical protein